MVEVSLTLLGAAVGCLVGVILTLIWYAPKGHVHSQPDTPANPTPPFLRGQEWHPTFLATQAYRAFANHAIDTSRPLKGVWMCGVSGSIKDHALCPGFVPENVTGNTSNGTILCKHRQWSTGACLKAGRRTAMEEIVDD